MLDHVAVAGTVDEVAEGLQAFVDAGARHLVCLPCGADAMTTAEQLLEEIGPRLHAPSA
ncbi:MAG TPA: hypothetical protein VIB48_03485 [Acidimicrobiia bacterium]